MVFSILSKFLMLAAVLLIAGAVYGYISIQKSLENSDVIEATIASVDSSSSGSSTNSTSTPQISWATVLSYRFQGRNYVEKDPVTYSDENKPEVGGK